jgi:hypothetical protein
MDMQILRVALLAGIVFTAIFVIIEVIGWRTRNSVVSSRQRLIRVSCGLTLICLLGLVLAGNILGILFTTDTTSMSKNPLLTIAYGSACIGIACLLVVLALLDIKEGIQSYRRNFTGVHIDIEGKDGRSQ